VPGATLEDKRWSLTLHYRTVADHAGVLALGRAARAAAARHALDVRRGKKVFELRAPVRVDKGTAVLRLARELGADAPGAAALYAGDDVTDEDAFRALRAGLPSAVTVRVAADDADAARDTSAEFTVLGLPAFREVLARLASAE
jgi:trehalose 6-phosphate phosphatase